VLLDADRGLWDDWERLDADPGLRDDWERLTTGRQRGWLLHFNGSKQSNTRIARIERATPQILEGLWMHDYA
jgi:uncharacterized protein YdeI (YjbR/CyaY-like superfamily)